MPKLVDLTGKEFGNLIVLKRVENDKHGKPRWLVKCSCGKEVIKSGNHLPDSRFCRRGGHSRIGEELAAFNGFYNQVRNGAVRRKYEWCLTKENVKSLSKQCCFYCGCFPKQVFKYKTNSIRGEYIYNGIDRIDNSRGYTIDNVVPCCGICNTMKMDMSLIDFRSQILYIFKHWIS